MGRRGSGIRGRSRSWANSASRSRLALTGLDVADDGRVRVTTNANGIARVWSPGRGKEPVVLPIRGVRDARLSPDGTLGRDRQRETASPGFGSTEGASRLEFRDAGPRGRRRVQPGWAHAGHGRSERRRALERRQERDGSRTLDGRARHRRTSRSVLTATRLVTASEDGSRPASGASPRASLEQRPASDTRDRLTSAEVQPGREARRDSERRPRRNRLGRGDGRAT